jgi:membrane protein
MSPLCANFEKGDIVVPTQQTTQAVPADSMRMFTLVCYFLHVLGIATGGISSIVAVIINYMKRREAFGTPYQGHHEYMIRTFWVSVISAVILMVLMILSAVLIYLAPFAWLVIWPAAIALLVWVLYRLVTGGLKAYHAEPLS